MLHVEGVTPEAHCVAPDADHARITKADSAIVTVLQETFKEKVWHSVKFILSENQIIQLALLTLKKANLPGKFTPDSKIMAARSGECKLYF